MPHVIDYSRSARLAALPVGRRLYLHHAADEMTFAAASLWAWGWQDESSLTTWREYKELRRALVPVSDATWQAPTGYARLLAAATTTAWQCVPGVDRDAFEREIAALSLTSARLAELASRAELMLASGDPAAALPAWEQRDAAAALDAQLAERRARAEEFLDRLQTSTSSAPMRWTALHVGDLERYVHANEQILADVRTDLARSAARLGIERVPPWPSSRGELAG